MKKILLLISLAAFLNADTWQSENSQQNWTTKYQKTEVEDWTKKRNRVSEDIEKNMNDGLSKDTGFNKDNFSNDVNDYQKKSSGTFQLIEDCENNATTKEAKEECWKPKNAQNYQKPNFNEETMKKLNGYRNQYENSAKNMPK